LKRRFSQTVIHLAACGWTVCCSIALFHAGAR
jgi:hypothetical protein